MASHNDKPKLPIEAQLSTLNVLPFDQLSVDVLTVKGARLLLTVKYPVHGGFKKKGKVDGQGHWSHSWEVHATSYGPASAQPGDGGSEAPTLHPALHSGLAGHRHADRDAHVHAHGDEHPDQHADAGTDQHVNSGAHGHADANYYTNARYPDGHAHGHEDGDGHETATATKTVTPTPTVTRTPTITVTPTPTPLVQVSAQVDNGTPTVGSTVTVTGTITVNGDPGVAIPMTVDALFSFRNAALRVAGVHRLNGNGPLFSGGGSGQFRSCGRSGCPLHLSGHAVHRDPAYNAAGLRDSFSFA